MSEQLIVRASSVSNLLTKPRSKSELLSETAKTLIESIAIENLYGLRSSFDSKYTAKGNEMELASIEMLNNNWGSDFVKNTQRIKFEKFSGEADIVGEDSIIDMKCSWSADTFPWTSDAAVKAVKKAGYEHQVRTYMMLYDKSEAYVVFALLSTPPHLLRKNELAYHQVDHIPEQKRITSVKFERDEKWEQELLEAWNFANQYYGHFMQILKDK